MIHFPWNAWVQHSPSLSSSFIETSIALHYLTANQQKHSLCSHLLHFITFLTPSLSLSLSTQLHTQTLFRREWRASLQLEMAEGKGSTLVHLLVVVLSLVAFGFAVAAERRRSVVSHFIRLRTLFNFIHIVKVVLLLFGYSCLPLRMLVFLLEDKCVVASQFDIDLCLNLCLSFVIAFPVIFSLNLSLRRRSWM